MFACNLQQTDLLGATIVSTDSLSLLHIGTFVSEGQKYAILMLLHTTPELLPELSSTVSTAGFLLTRYNYFFDRYYNFYHTIISLPSLIILIGCSRQV